MNGSDYTSLHAHRGPANADSQPGQPPAPSGFIATLHRIGNGAAADGQPWPEHLQKPGRMIALADADCALAGLRIAQEMVLACERIRQNGPDSDYLGDRVMEGLMMACLALTAQVSAQMRPAE